MNTYTSLPSPIEILNDSLTLKVDYGAAYQTPVPADLKEELATIWIPVFRGRSNLKSALEALQKTSEELLSDLCAWYLAALGSME